MDAVLLPFLRLIVILSLSLSLSLFNGRKQKKTPLLPLHLFSGERSVQMTTRIFAISLIKGFIYFALKEF